MSQSDDEFYEIINTGLDARVIYKEDRFLIARLFDEDSVFEIVTDGNSITLLDASLWLRAQFPDDTWLVWETTELETGRFSTTIAFNKKGSI